MTSQFVDMSSLSNFFDVVLFLLLRLVTGLSFMSVSSLVLELWQFTFTVDRPEIWKLEIPPSGDWVESGISNLTHMYLMNCTKCCKMPGLQLLPFLSYEGKTNRGVKLPPSPPPQTRIKKRSCASSAYK